MVPVGDDISCKPDGARSERAVGARPPPALYHVAPVERVEHACHDHPAWYDVLGKQPKQGTKVAHVVQHPKVCRDRTQCADPRKLHLKAVDGTSHWDDRASTNFALALPSNALDHPRRNVVGHRAVSMRGVPGGV